MESLSREHRALVFKLCVVWGFVIGSWAVLQVAMPLVLKDIVGKDAAPTWQGVFTSTTALSGIFFCGCVGHFSDRIGRLELLLPWTAFFFFSTILVVLGDITSSVYMLWTTRLAAISIPSTILYAFLSDYLSGSALLESFSFVGATFGGSMLTSSILCGLISWYYSRLAALIFGASLAGIAMLLTSLIKLSSKSKFPPPVVDSKTEATALFLSSGSIRSSLRYICKDTLLRNLMIALAFLRVGNVNTHMMLVLFLDFRLGWELPEVSLMAGVSSFLAIIVQLVGVKLVISSNIVLPVLFFVLAMVPIVSASFALAMTGFQMYAVAMLHSTTTLASTIFNAKITSLASENGVAGLALGCVGTLQNILEFFAAMFLGKLMSWSFENQPRTRVMSGLPFLLNGAFLMLVVIIVIYSHKRYGAGRSLWVESPHSGRVFA